MFSLILLNGLTLSLIQMLSAPLQQTTFENVFNFIQYLYLHWKRFFKFSLFFFKVVCCWFAVWVKQFYTYWEHWSMHTDWQCPDVPRSTSPDIGTSHFEQLSPFLTMFYLILLYGLNSSILTENIDPCILTDNALMFLGPHHLTLVLLILNNSLQRWIKMSNISLTLNIFNIKSYFYCARCSMITK